MPTTPAYAWNGIPLDNDEQGWWLTRDTNPAPAHTTDLPSYQRSGGDGSGIGRAATAEPMIPIVLEVNGYAAVETLNRITRHPGNLTRLDAPGIHAAARRASFTPRRVSLATDSAPETWEVSIAFGLYELFWRDDNPVTTAAATLTSNGSVDVPLAALAGMSGVARDAIVRVRGSFGNLKVAGANGTFFTYPAVAPSTQYLRFESASGRAFLTNTDTWSGGTEVTGDIGNGPGWPYFFEIEAGSALADITPKLAVSTDLAGASAAIEVRVRGAYAR